MNDSKIMSQDLSLLLPSNFLLLAYFGKQYRTKKDVIYSHTHSYISVSLMVESGSNFDFWLS